MCFSSYGRGCWHTARQASFSVHPARHVADRHDPTGWAPLIEPWRKIERRAVAFLTFMAASVVTVWAFGPGLLQVVLDTPGLAQLAAAICIPPGPISSVLPLTVSPLDPVLPFGDSNLFQPLFFSTLFGCLDRHAGHDRASHFFCLTREQPATRKQLTLSSAISGILQFCVISCRYSTAQLHHPVYELLPPARRIGSGRVDRRNSSADG